MAECGKLLQHVLIVGIQLQLWQVAIVEHELKLVVVAGDDEIGHDIVGMGSFALTHPRLGVEAVDALDGGIELLLVELQCFHDTTVVVVGKEVETAVDHHRGPLGCIVLTFGSVQLEGKAFLKIACSDAGRI